MTQADAHQLADELNRRDRPATYREAWVAAPDAQHDYIVTRYDRTGTTHSSRAAVLASPKGH